MLQMHLKKLETAGLVEGSLELSEDGKAMRYFEAADFDIELTPALIAEAATSLSQSDAQDGE